VRSSSGYRLLVLDMRWQRRPLVEGVDLADVVRRAVEDLTGLRPVRVCPACHKPRVDEMFHKRDARCSECRKRAKVQKLEFPTKSGQGIKRYSACSYSAGATYPSDECRRFRL